MADLATGLKNPSEIKRIGEINSASVSTPSRAIELLRELKQLNGDLSKDGNLRHSLENNFFDEKLENYTIDKVIGVLEKMEAKEAEENKDKDIEQINEEEKSEIIVEDKKEEQISNVDIKKLLEEYDDHIKKGLNEKEARDRIFRDHPNTNKDNVERFIRRQQEIYKETLNNIKENRVKEETKPIDRAAGENKETKVKQINEEKLARIIAEEAVIKERDLGIKIGEEKAKKITEEITKEVIVPHAVSGERIDELSLNKFATLDDEDRVELDETFKVIDSKIQIENKVETLAEQIINEFKEDARFQDKANLDNEKIENVIRKEIYEEISGEIVGSDEKEINLPEKISKAVQRTEKIEIEPELKTAIKTQTARIEKQTQDWVQQNDSNFNEIRGQILQEKVQQQIFSENKKITASQARNVQEYTKILKEIYTSPSGISQYKKELVLKLESPEINRDQAKEAWTDLRGLTQVLKMKPGEFDQFISKYKQIKQGLGDIKLPFKIKEARSLDTIVRLSENPAIKSLINRTQRYIGAFERITNVTSGRFMTGFYERIGLKVSRVFIEKIGNQAVKAFAENSLQIIAKNGLEKGVGMILKGVLSGGVRAGATAAAGASSAAAAGGAAAAAGASATVPVVGWIVAAVIAAYEFVIKPLLKLAGNIAKKLGIDLGIKKFLQETLGKFLGGIADFGLKVGGILLAPAALAGIGTAVATATPVIICVIIGIFAYQLLLGGQVSSLVPPIETGNQIVDDTSPGYDPSQPDPVITNTRCSVADKVIMTNQCSPENKSTLMPCQPEGNRRTICSSGCGPTSVSMVLQAYNQSLTPAFLVTDPDSWYVKRALCDGTSFVEARRTFQKYLGENSVSEIYGSGEWCSQSYIRESICNNKIVMVLIGWERPDGRTGGHYFDAVAVTDDDKIVVKDPSGGRVVVDPFTPSNYNKARVWIKGCLLIDANLI